MVFKSFFLIITTYLFSSFVLAKGELSGLWNCEISSKTGAPISATFTLSINEDETRFIRNGQIKMSTGLPKIPKIELKTEEEGLFIVEDTSIKIMPRHVSLEIIKGKELIVGQVYDELMKDLSRDEVGVINKQNKNSFSFDVEEGTQTNHCLKMSKT
jgi:hypothetical protein